MDLPSECSRRFTEAKLVWAGTASAAFNVKDLERQQPAVVKVLTGPCAIGAAERDQFVACVEKIRAIDDPGLAAVVGFGLGSGSPWVAHEYLPGPSVREALKARSFDWRNAFEVGAQMAQTLGAAHKAGVVHGDLRPEKIVTAREGVFKLVDCGLAPFLRETPVSTARGTLWTTAATLAPERIKGSPASPLTDVYALGATLYEMVTGRPLFVDESGRSLLDHHLSTPPPAPSRENADIPAAVDALILKALSKAPGHRFPSAAAMAGALREALAMDKGDTVPRMRPRKGTGANRAPSAHASGGSLAPGAHLRMAHHSTRAALLLAAALGVGLLVLAVGRYRGARVQRDGAPTATVTTSRPASSASPTSE